MEIEKRRRVRDDRTSDCRSFGSNYHPCSQSRKISIGIMVDSVLKTKPTAIKEDEVAVPNAEQITSSKQKSLEGEKERQGVKAMKSKQTKASEQENSPWISTKSKSSTLKTVHCAKQTSSLPANSGGQNKLSSGKNSPKMYSAQFVANQTPTLQPGDGKKKKIDRVTYKSKGRDEGIGDRVEGFSFATAKELSVSDKGVIEDKTDKTENRSSEALRMKLWEILGTVSSPNKQFSNSQILEPEEKNGKLDENFDQKGDTVNKSRQNSDTIETDSENPDHTIKRPVTRSLTRKRAPARVPQNKVKAGISSSHIQKFQDTNIFSFPEELSGKLHAAANGSSSKSRKKKNKRHSSKIELRNICFPEKYNADKIPPVTNWNKIHLPAEKQSSFGSRMRGLPACAQVNIENVVPKSGSREKNSHESPVARKTDQLRDSDSTVFPENDYEHEDCVNPSLNKNVAQQDDPQSPTFRTKTPVRSSSPSSPLKTDQMKTGFCSPASAENIFTVGNIHSFKTWQTSIPDFHGANEKAQSSDDEEDLNNSPTRNSAPFVEEVDGDLSKSSSLEREYTSSEEDSPVNRGYKSCMENETLSSDTRIAETPKYTLHPAKRQRSHGSIKFNEFSPISPSPEGTEVGNEFCGPSKENQEDGLSRAVTLFALGLERLESKMKSVTRKKSSEILMSVSDGINLQLQNVESQIQTDVGKLTSLSKSKRKRLETRFQEHQEKLKLIHEKFKEEVNQHLQDCRTTLEGLEANQIEFKETVEREKSSHRKLLLEVEEAIETRLNDAERRVTSVHKLARERMLQLKHAIAECLMDEDILG